MLRGEVLDGCLWIEQRLQRSATLEVYRAIDTRDSTPLDLRVHLDLSSAGIERFESTCAALFAHPHPALERMVMWGKTERGARYAAVEVPAGPALEELLGEGLADVDVLRITTRALEALGHLHTLGLCHAALSAATVVLPRGNAAGATLTNVTLVPSSLIASEVSYPSVQVASARHAAPELIRTKSGPTSASDIFALGCVLYRMLSGLVPFASPTIMGTYLRVLYDEPSSSGPRLGPGEMLDALARRMLAKSPELRPTPRDALRTLALDPASVDVSADVEWLDREESSSADLPTQTRRRHLALVLSRSLLPSSSSLDSEGQLDQVQRLLEGVAGRLDRLSDGTLLVELGGERESGGLGDPLIRAGRAALLLQAALPLASFAVARGNSAHSLDAAEQLLGQLGRGMIGLAPDTVSRMERHFDVELTPQGALLWEREAHTRELTAGKRRQTTRPDLEEVTLVETKRLTIEIESIPQRASEPGCDLTQLESLPTLEMDLSAMARSMISRVRLSEPPVPGDARPEAAEPVAERERRDTDAVGPPERVEEMGDEPTISQRLVIPNSKNATDS